MLWRCGRREMQTLRKLPSSRPRKKAAISIHSTPDIHLSIGVCKTEGHPDEREEFTS